MFVLRKENSVLRLEGSTFLLKQSMFSVIIQQKTNAIFEKVQNIFMFNLTIYIDSWFVSANRATVQYLYSTI
jgi:hypothetical protein